MLDIGQPVDLQGIDVRLFDDEQGVALQELKHKKHIKIAWDNPKQNLDDKIEHLLEYVRPSKILCYVLIGYWSKEEEDLMRIYHLWDKFKIDAYVMPFNKNSAYQRGIARWCNNFWVRHMVSWEEYKSLSKESKFQQLIDKNKKLDYSKV